MLKYSKHDLFNNLVKIERFIVELPKSIFLKNNYISAEGKFAFYF